MNLSPSSVPFFNRSFRTNSNGVVFPVSSMAWYRGTPSFNGIENPSWRDHVAKHISATTPMDAIWYSAAYRAYAGAWTNVAKVPDPGYRKVTLLGTHNGSGPMPSYKTPPTFSGPAYTSAHNEAVKKLYSRIRKIESMSNIGEDLGEISQTYRMVSRPMRGVLDVTNHALDVHLKLLKSSKWNNVKAVAKGLADCALEWRFGMQPLIKSLADASVAIGNRDVISYYVDFKAAASVSELFPGSISTNTTDYEYCRQTFNRFMTSVAKVRYLGQYEIASDVDKTSYAKSLGLTWRELPVTLYNLIPYSFVLDYVLNLNQFVEALAVPWNRVAWCNLTERMTFSDTIASRQGPDLVVGNFLHMTPTFYQPMFMTIDSHRTRRRDQKLIPMPWLQVKTPNQRQNTNLLALFASRLPVLSRFTKGLKQSGHSNALDNAFDRVLLGRRASMNKVPYPFHKP